MRTFLMKVNHPLEKIEYNNTPKNRTDMIARVIISTFWLDHDLRRDAELYLCFNNNKTLHYTPVFKNMNPDERNISSFINYILEGRKFPGINLEQKTFEEIIKELQNQKRKIYFLDAAGQNLSAKTMPAESVFILGDNKGYGNYKIPEEASKISIGSKSYLTSHCISYLNIYLDGE